MGNRNIIQCISKDDKSFIKSKLIYQMFTVGPTILQGNYKRTDIRIWTISENRVPPYENKILRCVESCMRYMNGRGINYYKDNLKKRLPRDHDAYKVTWKGQSDPGREGAS